MAQYGRRQMTTSIPDFLNPHVVFVDDGTGCPAHEDYGAMTAQSEQQIRDLLMRGQKIPPDLAGGFSHRRLSQIVGDAQQALAQEGGYALATLIDSLFDGGGLFGEGPIM